MSYILQTYQRFSPSGELNSMLTQRNQTKITCIWIQIYENHICELRMRHEWHITCIYTQVNTFAQGRKWWLQHILINAKYVNSDKYTNTHKCQSYIKNNTTPIFKMSNVIPTIGMWWNLPCNANKPMTNDLKKSLSKTCNLTLSHVYVWTHFMPWSAMRSLTRNRALIVWF